MSLGTFRLLHSRILCQELPTQQTVITVRLTDAPPPRASMPFPLAVITAAPISYVLTECQVLCRVTFVDSLTEFAGQP